MIFFLMHTLVYFGVQMPQVFFYTSTRMMLAAITSLLITIICGPWFIKTLYSLKIGQWIRKDECPLLGQLHKKKQDTPTMGGILILFSLIIALLLWMDLANIFTLILLSTTLFLGLIGGIDDFLKLRRKSSRGLSAKGKLIAQVGYAALIAAYLLIPAMTESVHQGAWFSPPIIKDSEGAVPMQEAFMRVYAPFKKRPLVTLTGGAAVLSALFIVFVITGASNSVNLTDGLDGLAAGNLIMVAICLGMFAFLSNNYDIAHYLNILYIEGSGEIAIFLAAFVGGCIGFLWYNSHPAQVFMGDTGSLALGGIIGISAVLLRRELLLGLIGGVFVMEALSVILQVASYRLRDKKRIFLCAPLHHHFEYQGWPETKVVIRFWIVGFLLATLGIVSLKFQ